MSAWMRLGQRLVPGCSGSLMLPDYERAGVIGEYFQDPRTRNFAELLIDAEEDKFVRAVLVGMLREAELGR